MDEHVKVEADSTCEQERSENGYACLKYEVSTDKLSIQNGKGCTDPSRELVIGEMSERTDLLTYDLGGETPQPGKGMKDETPVGETDIQKIRPLHYSVSETPSFHLLVIFGLQQALLPISAPLSVATVVAEVVCAQKDEDIKAQIISASMLMSGIATILMSTFGIRLPIFQGASSMYLVPLLVMSSSTEWQCSQTSEAMNPSDNTTILMSFTDNSTTVHGRDMILNKISRLSGSLMLVGVFHFLIGALGLVGIIIRYVGPVTIVPAIILVGLHLFKVIVKFCSPSWLVASVTILFNLVFSLFFAKRKTPIPFWSSAKGFHIFWFPLHQMFPILLSILIGWTLSAVLTNSGFYTHDSTSPEYLARSDAKGDIISKASFLDIPYPGKLVGYSFSAAGFLSFFIATIMSVLDSIGDYSACAKAVHAPRIPKFAFNRGIAVEGLSTILSGSMGCCHATTSYGPNIGGIKLTGVASRRVFQVCGIVYILCAVVGKIGALFLTIPLPVLGGTMTVLIGLFIGVVISYLEAIDLRSTRNLAIIGTALLVGMMLPYWVSNNREEINTGLDELDTLIKILLSNPSFVGGFFACVLDNAVPGTIKERGLLEQMNELDVDKGDLLDDKIEYMENHEVYRLPFIPQSFRKSMIVKIFPLFDSS
ncbi:hypothetical protein RRG08_015776 [Elysia crispata]|uniref:Solute carrier family 23 member 2 n=1 Tax=Elysia crispata TaxID=231223 RepID=A0AAE0YLE0_9GAST|nr:hypothetical protein RRG08_015776 [Elysia crispata]